MQAGGLKRSLRGRKGVQQSPYQPGSVILYRQQGHSEVDSDHVLSYQSASTLNAFPKPYRPQSRVPYVPYTSRAAAAA